MFHRAVIRRQADKEAPPYKMLVDKSQLAAQSTGGEGSMRAVSFDKERGRCSEDTLRDDGREDAQHNVEDMDVQSLVMREEHSVMDLRGYVQSVGLLAQVK